jgi:hypothetical protein
MVKNSLDRRSVEGKRLRSGRRTGTPRCAAFNLRAASDKLSFLYKLNGTVTGLIPPTPRSRHGPTVAVEEPPKGKWAGFLRLAGHEEPINLGKEFKSEERAENWQKVSESLTAVEMMIRKHKK